jgi:hypothetical protein
MLPYYGLQAFSLMSGDRSHTALVALIADVVLVAFTTR